MTTRRRSITILIALFFGIFGAHHFYLNKPGQGMTYFLITVVGSVAFLLGPIISIISTIADVVKYLSLTDDEFDAKY